VTYQALLRSFLCQGRGCRGMDTVPHPCQGVIGEVGKAIAHQELRLGHVCIVGTS
jgi:hypothetical protein